MSGAPLDGLLVVSIEQAVSAPFATRQLADLGARVIKIERPDGGDFARHFDTLASGLGAHFTWVNRSKESLTLDIKQQDGLRILHRLLRVADVFVHNLAPGAPQRLGLAGPQLSSLYPRLVVCGISGYGADGDWADRRAYDLLVQAEAAVVSVTGSVQDPVKPGIAIADIGAAMYAYTQVLAALMLRERTGRGADIDVSMLDAVAEWMGYAVTVVKHHGTPRFARGLGHPAIAPYDAYRTKDGRLLALSVQNDREWQRLATDVLGKPNLARHPDFATNQRRVANRERLDAMVSNVLATMDLDDAIGRLDAVGVACGRVNDVPDLADHPALTSRNRWSTVGSPVGPVPSLLPPGRSSTWSPRLGPIPALGQHTDGILRELGYQDGELATLRAARVV